MYKDGYKHACSIDIAKSATNKMLLKYSRKYPELECNVKETS